METFLWTKKCRQISSIRTATADWKESLTLGQEWFVGPYAHLSGPAVYIAKGVAPGKTIRKVQTYLVSVSKIGRGLTPFQVTGINSPIISTVLDSA